MATVVTNCWLYYLQNVCLKSIKIKWEFSHCWKVSFVAHECWSLNLPFFVSHFFLATIVSVLCFIFLRHLFTSSFCVTSFFRHFITTILPRIYVSISRVWDDSSWALFLKAVGTDLYRFICWESPFCPINIVSRKITYSTQQYCHVEFLFTSFNKIVKPQRFSEKY